VEIRWTLDVPTRFYFGTYRFGTRAQGATVHYPATTPQVGTGIEWSFFSLRRVGATAGKINYDWKLNWDNISATAKVLSIRVTSNRTGAIVAAFDRVIQSLQTVTWEQKLSFNNEIGISWGSVQAELGVRARGGYLNASGGP